MTPGGRTRRRIRATAFAITVLCLGWTVRLLLFGGFAAEIFGAKIRAHDSLRPMLLAAAAAVVFVLANGVKRSRESCVAAMRRIDERLMVGALASATFLLGLAFSTMSASGADSYGYVSQADLWLDGHLSISQPWVKNIPWPLARWTFSPLGYRPMEDGWAIVPTYAPGLPILMAAAQFIGGRCAVFWVVPLAGSALVVATYGLGRRLGSPRAGLIAAWLVATSPAFLFALMWPMSDVPAAAAWAVAWYFLLDTTGPGAVAAGLSTSIAILIRPNLAPMAGVMVLWFVLKAWRDGPEQRPCWLKQAVWFVAGLTPGVVAMAVINRTLYGSCLRSGYGDLGGLFAWANFLPNVRNYASWFIESQTPIAVAGVLALFVPLRRLWPLVPDRSICVFCGLFVLGIWVEYCAYVVFAEWWYVRFLLPSWPFIMIGLANVGLLGTRSARLGVALIVAAMIVALGIRGFRVAAGLGVFELWKAERRYASVAKLVQTMTDPHSVIITLQHSGTVRYYGGRITLRFDYLDRGWLDRSVSWLADHGAHAYALLEDWEIPDFKRRFAGQHMVARLGMPPVVAYNGPAKIYLYDLLRPDGSAAPVHTVVETFTGSRCTSPAPTPHLILKE